MLRSRAIRWAPVTGIATWPLVGREREVVDLVAALRDGRGVVLTGEAGVGKTRLGHAVLERLGADGWATAVFEAGPAAAAVPFLPFASLLSPSVDDGLERIVDATATLVARGERVAVLIDDAHALDDVSLAFVSHLIATTDLRVLLTIRSSDAASRLVRRWNDVLPRVDVAPLDRPAVAELLRGVLGQAVPSAVRWVWEATAGNPLFVRELVTDAVERGALVERGDRWMLEADGGPPGRRLRDVVGDRFGSLTKGEREAVELLAVGAPIGLDVLERLAGADVVQELEHRGLVHADRAGRRVAVRLAHAIHAEVVRETLGLSTVARHLRRLLGAFDGAGDRRSSDRLRIGLWRAELGDTSDPGSLMAAAEELVALIDSAMVGDVVAGSDVGTSAGHQLLEQAAMLARRGLDAGGGLPAATLLIRVLSRLGRHDDARAVRQSLPGLVRDEADGVLVAQLLSDVDTLVLGDPETAAARLLELESIVTSPDLLRALRSTRSTALAGAGALGEAHSLARQVLDDADATPLERIQASAASAIALSSGGRTSEAIEVLDRAAELLSGDIGPSILTVLPRMFVLTRAGHLDELEDLVSGCYTLAEELGIDDGMGIFAAAQATLLLVRGRPRTALTWADTAIEHLGAINPVGVRRLALAARAHACALVEAPAAASAAIAALDALGAAEVFQEDETRARAWADVATGRGSQAVGLLVRDAELAAGRGYVTGAVAYLHDAARLGRGDLVAPRMAVLADGVDGAIAPVQAAHVAALAADDAEAVELAASRFADVGANLYAAEAEAQAAALHRGAGHRTRSTAAAARSRDLLARCEGAATPALAGVEPLASLTRREREIAQLASGGLSDRDIADQLVVSVRTVQTHLFNAYAKLGVAGRNELSAAIARY